METKRVPNLDWPEDLFCDAAAANLIEDLDNPFLEDCDFAPPAKHTSSGTGVISRDFALAE